MLVALSDTHSEADPQLTPHLRETIASADCLVHAGDFVTQEVFDEFEKLAGSVVAVHGNSDTRRLRNRFPETTTAEWSGKRLLVAHSHRHDETSLSLLARQENADVIITGHTHRPKIRHLGERLHVNPGSHAQPRGNRPAYALFERNAGEISVELRAPTGELIEGESI